MVLHMKYMVAAAMALSLCSCQSGKSVGRIQQKLATRAGEVCKAWDTCTIGIKEVTDFAWDKVYVFRTTATSDDINNALGTPLHTDVEFSRKIVFLKEGRIVYSEVWPSNLENWEDGDVVFVMPVDRVYVEYTPDTSEFIVSKNTLLDGGIYYELTQTKKRN